MNSDLYDDILSPISELVPSVQTSKNSLMNVGPPNLKFEAKIAEKYYSTIMQMSDEGF